MNKLEITAEQYQIINLIVEGENLEIHLKFNPIGCWFFDLKYQNKQINGVRLATGVLHLQQNNVPFDFLIHSQGLDPFTQDAFSSGYCDFYVLEKFEVEQVKNTEIKV
jgi:hypothetical protein